ncbi:MAG: hypothetical protein AAFN92_23795, partial [Bacteroidota bacterium]
MLFSRLRPVGLFLLLTLLAACKTDSAEVGPDPDFASGAPTPLSREAAPQQPTEPPKPVPRFVGDSAYAYVAKQVDFGARVMNTPAHEATKDWLIAKLEDFGAEVVTQSFVA